MWLLDDAWTLASDAAAEDAELDLMTSGPFGCPESCRSVKWEG